MKKKVLSIATMLLGVMVLATGCGKSESASSTGEDATKAERVEKAELTVYAPKGKNTDWLVGVTERYNEKYQTEISIKSTDVAPPAITQKLTPLLIGKETLPDLSYIEDSAITGLVSKFPSSFENLTKNGYEEKFAEEIYPTKLSSIKATAPENDLYGFPQDLGMVMMFYRQDLFEEAGVTIDEVKTWDDLIEAGKKIKEKTGTELMALDANGETSLVTYIMQQQDTPPIDKDGNSNLATTAAKNALKIVDKLKEADVVAYYSSDKDRYTTFQQCAVIIEGTWLAGNMQNNYPDQAGKWRIAPLVNYSDSDQGKSPVNGGSSWYVGANAKNKNAAMQLMEFAVLDQESQGDLLSRGSASTLLSAYDTEAGQAGFPYFGEQKIYDAIRAAGENAIEIYYYPYASDGNSYLKMAVYDYWKGTDLDKALKKNADEFAQKYNIEVN